MASGSIQLSSLIDGKLASVATASNSHFIFRIDPILRRENEGAYEPEILSIGPYHRGKDNLQKMEMYKLRYLEKLLKRRDESSTERYIAALLEVEKKARNCYADNISLSPYDFVEMMLLDGCFVIEFLRRYGDPIISMELHAVVLCRDLLLFENQLPFFVLVLLFDMTRIPGEEDLIHLAISRLYPFIAAPSESSYDIGQQQEILHLLSLMYKSWCSSVTGVIQAEAKKQRNSISGQNRDYILVFTFADKFKRLRSEQEQEEEEKDVGFLKSACELKEHGIEFRMAEQSKSWLDIKFKNGVMEIPPLTVHDGTESVLRNLIAFEQYMFDLGYSWKFVTDYTTFMDCLINTSKDVKMLRHERILSCWLGNDEAIADMFNKIGKNVVILSSRFTYEEVFEDVNKHCNRRRNTWKAYLRNNYFSNPWSIISFLAATLLLLLTLVQTIFTIVK